MDRDAAKNRLREAFPEATEVRVEQIEETPLWRFAIHIVAEQTDEEADETSAWFAVKALSPDSIEAVIPELHARKERGLAGLTS